jgi:hypothetical protein
VAGLGGAALTAWVPGDSVAYRYRRAYYAALEERAARLQAERASIFAKLGLEPSGSDNRRVLATIKYLES